MTAVVLKVEADDRPLAPDAVGRLALAPSTPVIALDDVLGGPRPALDRGGHVDWTAWSRAVDDLARRAGLMHGRAVPDAVHVLAAAPLPLLVQLGLRVGRFYAGRAVAHGQHGAPAWLDWDSGAEALRDPPYFKEEQGWEAARPNKPGWARLTIAAGGVIARELVREEAEGSFPPLALASPDLVTEADVGTCIAELRKAIERTARLYGDQLLGVAIYLRGPAPLAFHLGRMINLNAVRAIRLYNYHPRQGYTLALELPPRDQSQARTASAPTAVGPRRARRRWTTVPVELEVLTPAFIGGPTKDRSTCTLRATELRGLLRYWFRVAYASVLSTDAGGDERAAVRALYKAESAIFGSTEQRARVRVVLPDRGTARVIQLDTHPDRGRDRGRGYLAYGAYDKNEPTSGLVGRARMVLELDADALDAAHERMLAVSLWLLTRLGGLGARARKGYGSLHVELPAGAGPPWGVLPWGRAQTPAAYAALLEKGMDVAVGAATALARARGASTGSGAPIASLRTLRYAPRPSFLVDPFRSADVAHETIGRRILDFRSTRQRGHRNEDPLPDYFTVKDYRRDREPREAPALVDRAALGLPLPFQYTTLHGQRAIVELDGTEGQDRVPSPVWIRVARLLGDDFAVLLCHLPAGGDPLLGARARLRAPDDRHHPKRPVTTSPTFVDVFLREVTR